MHWTFGLGSLLLVLLMAQLLFAWMASIRREYERQHEACEALRSLNAEGVLIVGSIETSPAKPQWFSVFVNEGQYYEVDSVPLGIASNLETAENACGYLASMRPTVQSVSLWGDTFDDECLRIVTAAQPQLRTLVLTQVSVTDAGMRELSVLQQLETCYISSTEISDASLGVFLQLPHLSNLQLNDSEVTDAGVAQLGKAQRLLWLDLSESSAVTIESLKALADAPRLESVCIPQHEGEIPDWVEQLPFVVYWW
jgi:hypothetical protein